ncbi:MAG: exosortase A [Undibacterium sp.]|nr:exosortase A [Undibacterium sp.]
MIDSSNKLSKFWKSLAIALALCAPLFIYFSTAQSIVSIWNSSETFAHGYIIAPISLWLIWQRRDIISRIEISPYWPALLILAACGFGWLLADLADVQVVKQYTFVTMIPASALFVLGLRMSWAMAFPLMFLLLAVPFGEIFIGPLINITADFTVAALQMTGIPVLREGTTFAIPSGNWSVVEACSGVRYLISSFTLGCLYAYLTYRSYTRRALFIAFAIIVPIVANGLRAYMIVMIGHLSSMTLAVGFDHLIYGWLFFGLVMFLMFWVGSIWREPTDTPASESKIAAADTPMTEAKTSQVLVAAVTAILCISFWPFYANYLDRAGANTAVVNLESFHSEWKDVPVIANWTLGYMPANAEFNHAYQRDAYTVGMAIRYYRNQTHESALISSSNQLVQSKDPVWHQTSEVAQHELISNIPLDVIESTLKDNVGRNVLVWRWYWIDDRFTSNAYKAKLLQAKEKFLMRGDDGAAIIFYASFADKPDEARIAMRQFLSEHMAPLNSTLSQNKKH